MAKFFVTTGNGWVLLVEGTKISILVALGVIHSTLCEIKMRKLDKQHIREIEYY